jgi:UDP-N-acetylmuramate dehydrogenase
MMAMSETTTLRGEMRYDEPMSRHTSLRVGGVARRYYQPADRDDLAIFLATLPADEPLFWLGLGSNLLVRDGGLDATVIALQGRLDSIVELDGERIYAEAGATCAKVARVSSRNGYVGCQFLAGIPGLIGGALAMNAGAFGGETWASVETVETVDRRGDIHVREVSDYEIAYRQVNGRYDEWFVAATFGFTQGNPDELQQQIRDLLRKRSDTQPTNKPSCGSVFRNPKGDHAARLIEAAGLKGLRIGGACVSDKHANFILNDSDASADDIERLIDRVRDRVFVSSGIDLIPEVHVVGKAG